MSDPGKAVFLSYASQDAEAAKCICAALRAAGIEVWFDQNELVGGDAWDHKIRTQIKECALLIPIISENTQARTEGYFRLEWRLADQRTHLMAKGRPFLLPVVIDDTRDAEAQVPDSFTEVQWTRLKGGEGAEKFVERVKKLLSGGGTSSRESASHPPIPAAQELSPPRKTGQRWLVPAILGVVAITAIGFWLVRKPAVNVGHETPASGTQNQNPPPAVPLSKARQLIERARTILANGSLTRAQLDTAGELCDRALQLDPTDAIVWNEAARTDLLLINPYGYDPSDERRKRAQFRATRALNLAPDLFEVRAMQAAVMAHAGGSPALLKEAEATFRELIASHPDDHDLVIQLAEVLREQKRFDEAATLFEKIGEFEVAGWSYYVGGNSRAGLAAVNRSLSQKRAVTALQLKAFLQSSVDQDLSAAQATVDQLRPSELLAELPAAAAIQVALFRRDHQRLLEVVKALPEDYLNSNAFRGPKQYFTGLAHEMAGQTGAAEAEWRAGLAVVQDRLKAAPDNREVLLRAAWLQASLGAKTEATRLLERAQEVAGLDHATVDEISAPVFLRLGRKEEFLTWLTGFLHARAPQWEKTHAEARFSPIYDSLRGDPRFEKLLRDTLPEGAKPFDEPKPKTPDPRPADRSQIDQKSIAVLAFANLSDDKGNEYFSDGISEELLNVLAKVPGLKVTARTSSFHFKGKDTPIPEIAAQLGVAYVVEGSVRKAGDKVRITAQLIKAADGFHVWSDTFTRDLKDVFAVQDEIAGLIAKNLELKIGTSSAASTVAVNPEAFELYVQARRAWNLRNAAGFQQAEELLTRALTLEPKFARAHAALADVWTLRALANGVIETYGQRSAPVFTQIVGEIEKALALDPDSSEARASLALIMRFRQWDLAACERELRRSIELNPNYATAHHWLGNCLSESGRIDEGLAEQRRAAELDPFSLRILENYAKGLVRAGRHEEALAVLGRAETLSARAPLTLYTKAAALLQLGRRAEAIAVAQELGDVERAEVLARAGEKAEAEAVLGEAEGWWRYELLVALGRTAEAITALRAEDVPASEVGNWLMDPRLDPFRKVPHFVELLATLGLTEAHARAQAWRAAHPGR